MPIITVFTIQAMSIWAVYHQFENLTQDPTFQLKKFYSFSKSSQNNQEIGLQNFMWTISLLVIEDGTKIKIPSKIKNSMDGQIFFSKNSDFCKGQNYHKLQKVSMLSMYFYVKN